MRPCPHCGHPLANNAHACSDCGADIAAYDVETTKINSPSLPVTGKSAQEESFLLWALIGITPLALAMSMGLLVYWTFGPGPAIVTGLVVFIVMAQVISF